MKHAGRIVQGQTVGHHLVRGVQYGDLRFRRRAIFAHLRINVAHVDVRAIGRGGHVTGAAARHEALGHRSPLARSISEISSDSRLATYSTLRAASSVTPVGSNPAGSLRSTRSDAVSTSLTVSDQELVT